MVQRSAAIVSRWFLLFHGLFCIRLLRARYLGFPIGMETKLWFGPSWQSQNTYRSTVEADDSPGTNGLFFLGPVFILHPTQARISLVKYIYPYIGNLWFVEKFMSHLSQPEKKGWRTQSMFVHDLEEAASVQRVTEEVIFHIACSFKKKQQVLDYCR